MKKYFLVAVLAIIAVGGYLFLNQPQSTMVGEEKDADGCLGPAGYTWCYARQDCERSWERYCTVAPPTITNFSCDGNKKISATFYLSDDKYVDLALSDGRALSLPHVISGSGARYAKTGDSFVFWNKGTTAFVMEGAVTTYANCIQG